MDIVKLWYGIADAPMRANRKHLEAFPDGTRAQERYEYES
jgi:hypothetical protein